MTKADIEKIDKEFAAEVAEIDRICVESPIPEPAILESVIYAD
jgi:hypothetical protein